MKNAGPLVIEPEAVRKRIDELDAKVAAIREGRSSGRPRAFLLSAVVGVIVGLIAPMTVRAGLVSALLAYLTLEYTIPKVRIDWIETKRRGLTSYLKTASTNHDAGHSD